MTNTGKIIDDYVNCDNIPTCQECEADKKIGDSTFTFCRLLREYGQRLKDKINEVIDT